jgi:tetratricopeptide (TPR) repeat protein
MCNASDLAGLGRAAVNRLILVVAVFALAACGSSADRASSYLEHAQALYDEGDYVKAGLEAKNAAQIEPKNPQVRYLLALLAEKDGNWRQVAGHLLAAIESDPNYVEARVKLGNLYFLGRAYELAAEQSEVLMTLAPDDIRSQLLAARVDFANKEVESAQERVDQALAIDPDNVEAILLSAAIGGLDDPEAGLTILNTAIDRLQSNGKDTQLLRNLRVSILESQQHYDEAEAEYKSLIEEFPDEPSYRTRLAMFYARQGRVDDAESMLREIVDQSTDEKLVAQANLVQFLGQAKSQEEAVEALEVFVEDSPDSIELQLALGRSYESLGRLDEARATYQVVAENDPRSEEGLFARNRLIALRVAEGGAEPDEIQALLDEILEDAPDNVQALLVQAGLKINAGQFDDAIADLRIVLRKQPDSEIGMLTLARTYLRKQDSVLALATYRQLLEQQPANKAAVLEASGIMIRSGDLEDAEEMLRIRLATVPADAESQIRLTDVLIAQKRLDEARVEAEKLRELSPDTGMGDYQSGRIYLAEENYAEAASAFRRAMVVTPVSEPALRGYLDAMVKSEQRPEAVAFLEGHVEQQPEFVVAHLMLAGWYSSNGDKAAAELEFREIIVEYPADARPYLGLAELYSSDPDKRLDILQQGLEAAPGNVALVLLLGGDFERLERYDDAIKVYEEALVSRPDSQIAANNLAALLLDYRSDSASWARALEVAQVLDPSSNPMLADTVGWAYYRNGDYPQAVRYLEQAVATAGEVPVLRYHLGMAYNANENPVGAKQELEKALNQAETDFPGIDEARDTLESLQSDS